MLPIVKKPGLLVLFTLSFYGASYGANSQTNGLNFVNSNNWSIQNLLKPQATSVPAAQKRYPDFASFKAACGQLPVYNFGKQNYTKTALTWDEFNRILQTFFAVNTKWYTKHAKSWVESALSPLDDFFNTSKEIFKPFVQKLVVRPQATIAVRGDLHGDIHSLLAYLDFLQTQGHMNGFKILNKNFYMVFLGDYVDRGDYGIEILYTLMRLKIENPDNVVLVRGNHEDSNVCSQFGFLKEFIAKFGLSAIADYKKIMRLYDFLPVALYLGSGSSISKDFLQCCHGGMEIGYNPTNLLDHKTDLSFSWLITLNQATEFKKLAIATSCKDAQLLKDFAISDFSQIGFMWNDFVVAQSGNLLKYDNGRGFVYGKELTRAVLQTASKGKHQLQGVLRAHQHAGDMLDSILDSSTNHLGISKLWKDATFSLQQDLWTGIVCTFLVAPNTPYSQNGTIFDFDAFALLKTADTFDKWQLKVHRNMLSDICKGQCTK